MTLQHSVLGAQGRQAALRHAHELRALPIAPGGAGWPVKLTDAASLRDLGLSGLAALLDYRRDGARERFTLRFAHGCITPLVFDARQRDEAATLIACLEETGDSGTQEGAAT